MTGHWGYHRFFSSLVTKWSVVIDSFMGHRCKSSQLAGDDTVFFRKKVKTLYNYLKQSAS